MLFRQYLGPALLVTLMACSPAGTNRNDVPKELFGSWERIRSEGGYGGDTIPGQEQPAHIVVEDDRISEFHGNRLVTRARFSVSEGRAFNFDDSVFTKLAFDEQVLLADELIILRLTRDTLVLSGTGSEAWTHHFSRREGAAAQARP